MITKCDFILRSSCFCEKYTFRKKIGHHNINLNYILTNLLTKTTVAQNEVALSYHIVRGLYFQAVVFVATIIYNAS